MSTDPEYLKPMSEDELAIMRRALHEIRLLIEDARHRIANQHDPRQVALDTFKTIERQTDVTDTTTNLVEFHFEDMLTLITNLRAQLKNAQGAYWIGWFDRFDDVMEELTPPTRKQVLSEMDPTKKGYPTDLAIKRYLAGLADESANPPDPSELPKPSAPDDPAPPEGKA